MGVLGVRSMEESHHEDLLIVQFKEYEAGADDEPLVGIRAIGRAV